MGEITFKGGQITTSDKVRAYFEYLFQAEEKGDPFPVDFDNVWALSQSGSKMVRPG